MDSIEKIQAFIKSAQSQKEQQEMHLMKVLNMKQVLETNMAQLDGAVLAYKNILKDMTDTTEAE